MLTFALGVGTGALLIIIGGWAFIASLPPAPEADYPAPDPAWAANDDGPEDHPPAAA
ncbi:MAG: hypothetical protein ACK4FB_07980 [Brevundimonas sp.]|uniref:hypothetical protein n=1 Tax=Brevundimonas sp. TaxID=1871086 RepID=UPI0039190043